MINKIANYISQQKIFLAFRFPNEQKIQFYNSQQFKLISTPFSSIQPSQKGFIFAPFNLSSNVYFFDFDNLTTTKENTPNKKVYIPHELNKKEYIELLNHTISNIQDKKYKKIVFSRTKIKKNIHEIEIAKAFINLNSLYKHAFISLVSLPNGEVWMGATPETLLTIDKHNAQTMALAGTKKVLSDGETEQWTKKEYDEQQIVQDFIEKRISTSGQQNIKKSQTYNKYIGNLAHLCTDFNFQFTGNPSQLLQELHPTPAVCGIPKEDAFQFIIANEKRDREFYAGFLGTMNMNGESKLFVNLRNLKYYQNTAYLYIGGGITAESDAEKEWLETENKAEIMQSAFFSKP